MNDSPLSELEVQYQNARIFFALNIGNSKFYDRALEHYKQVSAEFFLKPSKDVPNLPSLFGREERETDFTRSLVEIFD